jgi:hypothetical protein
MTIQLEEKQPFKEIALYILLGLIQVLFLWGFFQQVIFGKLWGTKPAGDIVLIMINIGVFLLILLFFSINLKTTITDKSISFKFFPFHIRRKIIYWKEIQNIRIIRYDGIKEFWGYGIRYMPGKGWCYTISGDYGISVTLKNGKKLLIGTYKPKEISRIFDDLKNRGIINKTY